MYLVREKIFISLILLLSATISCASSDKLLNHDHELISAETLTKLLNKANNQTNKKLNYELYYSSVIHKSIKYI